MPCDQIYQRMKEAERKRVEEERRKAIAKIEEALATGRARIVKQPNGQYSLIGVPLPPGMKDLCTLAALQQNNSDAYRRAVAQANAQAVNFAHQHHLAHQHGRKH